MLHQRWLEANRIVEDVAQVFRALKPQQQLLIVAQGDVAGASDPSDQLSRRIGALLAGKSAAPDLESSRRTQSESVQLTGEFQTKHRHNKK